MDLSPPMAQGASRKPLRPGGRFLLAHPAHALALGFGSGLSPKAPGTVGTLWAWLAFTLLNPVMNDVRWGALLLGALVLGTWACSVTARHLDVVDPSAIVWDEVLAFWLVLWLFMPAGFYAQCVAFVLFRFFDVVKPGPVGWADRRFPRRGDTAIGWRQGFGILFDDLVAAWCTLLVLAVLRFVGWM